MHDFITNITSLKGVNKQDWNSAQLIVQKPNVTLATKNTGRWMVMSTSARNKK